MSANDRMRIAYFFIPLPEPLGLPTRVPSTFEKLEDYDAYIDRVNTQDEVLEKEPKSEEFVSLISHQIRWSNPVMGVDDALMNLAKQALPWLGDNTPVSGEVKQNDPQTDSVVPTTEAVAATIVEGATILDENDSDNELSLAFDRVLEKIRYLQSAYFLIRKTPLTHVTRHNLPPVVFSAVAEVDPEGQLFAPDDGGATLFFTNQNTHGLTHHEELTNKELEQLDWHLESISAENPLAATLDLNREAYGAFYLRGDYRAAVVFMAAACEAKLDLLLQFLMWEEQLMPGDAAACFTDRNEPITARVKRHYAQRLRGQWSLDIGGPVRDWFMHVARLRNRVVHAAYSPTTSETDEAFESGHRLDSYIADLLAEADVLKRYPRTAISIVGKGGLDKRGKWTVELEEFADTTSEPYWWSVFSNWTRLFDEERARLKKEPVENLGTEKLVPMAVVLEDNSWDWVLHDRYNKLAARARPQPDESKEHIDNFTEAIGDITNSMREDGKPLAFSCSTNLLLEPMGEWTQEYLLVPEAQIFAQSQLPTSWEPK